VAGRQVRVLSYEVSMPVHAHTVAFERCFDLGPVVPMCTGPIFLSVAMYNNDGLDTCGPNDTLVIFYANDTAQEALSEQQVRAIYSIQASFPYFSHFDAVWTSASTLVVNITAVNTSQPYPRISWPIFSHNPNGGGTNKGPRTDDSLSLQAEGFVWNVIGACGTCIPAATRCTLEHIWCVVV